MTESQWFGVTFIGLGLMTTTLVLLMVRKKQILNRRGVPTLGQVVSVETTGGGEAGTATFSTIKFVTLTGETHIQWCNTHNLESASGLYCKEADAQNRCLIVERTLPGETHRFKARGRYTNEVDVVYDPEKPSRARAVSSIWIDDDDPPLLARLVRLVFRVVGVLLVVAFAFGPLIAGTLLLLEVWVFDT